MSDDCLLKVGLVLETPIDPNLKLNPNNDVTVGHV